MSDRRLLYGVLLSSSAFFVWSAALDLDRVRPITGDDAWVASVSHKLATQGVLGTDLYAGFFGAEHHYFINLPAHHVVQAVVFRIFGPGLAQARWVSVAAGVALLWTVGFLVRRWYGATVAAVAVTLMVFWRSHVVALDIGLPLLSVARSARYDLAAVALMWLTILAADHTLRHDGRWPSAIGTGLCAGLAALTQFYGFFTIVIVGVMWVWWYGLNAFEKPSLWLIALGFVLPLIPFAVYSVYHWHDALNQIRYAFPDRVPSFGPTAVLGVIAQEPLRFLQRLEPRLGRWALLVGTWPCVILLWRRIQDRAELGDRFVGLTLMVPAVLLAALETTKAPLYTLVVWPSLCIIAAVGVVELIRWTRRNRAGSRVFIGLVAIGVPGLILAEGGAAYWLDRRSAAAVSDYHAVGRSIDALLPTGGPVTGSARWWWALGRERRYLALNNLRLQWVASRGSEEELSVGDIIDASDVRFVVVDRDARSDLTRVTDAFTSQLLALLDRCSHSVGERNDHTYGRVEVRRIDSHCAARAA